MRNPPRFDESMLRWPRVRRCPWFAVTVRTLPVWQFAEQVPCPRTPSQA